MKGTDNFKAVISAYIGAQAQTDEVLAARIASATKNMDDCITYILNAVQESGNNGFTDDEVYGMAMHYYLEDDIDVGKPISSSGGHVVVNHVVELTEQEKAEAKQQAIDEVIAAEKQRMQGGKTKGNVSLNTPKPTEKPTTTAAAPTLFDL